MSSLVPKAFQCVPREPVNWLPFLSLGTPHAWPFTAKFKLMGLRGLLTLNKMELQVCCEGNFFHCILMISDKNFIETCRECSFYFATLCCYPWTRSVGHCHFHDRTSYLNTGNQRNCKNVSDNFWCCWKLGKKCEISSNTTFYDLFSIQANGSIILN
jgi:hypothetical protein